MIKLITSAAYVNQELAAEFGRLPPAFLPIGLTRLYEAQVPALGGGPVYLSLPESFTPYQADLVRLQDLGVTLLFVPDDITLADSILYALAIIAAPAEPLMLMHGDTLIDDIAPFLDGTNRIAVQSEGDDYSWAAVTVEGDRVTGLNTIQAGAERDDPLVVACGLFSFANGAMLMKALARARGDFVRALTIFAQDHDIRSVVVERWRDFGHLQTYFRSRRLVNTARAFNTLRIDTETARKSSVDRDKMTAESRWFSTAPASVQPYCARLLCVGTDADVATYTTEYLYAPTLSELYVFSSVGRPTWRRILASCQDFLSLCAGITRGAPGVTVLQSLVGDKTFKRLEAYASSGGVPIDQPLVYDGRPQPSLMSIANIVSDVVGSARARPETMMHGDFCFSNVLYNSRNGRISVIDPRGYIEVGQPTIYGDGRYDLAKMSHSIIGHYDHILAGRYALEADGPCFSIGFADREFGTWLGDAFADLRIDGVSANGFVVRAVMISLFLSMLPLHADRPDRQRAFIANALRLFDNFERSRS